MLPATKRAFFGTSGKDKRIFGAASAVGGGSNSASGGNSFAETQQYHQYYVEADDGSTGSDLKREMTDYQRSFSEGRLVDRWVGWTVLPFQLAPITSNRTLLLTVVILFSKQLNTRSN